MKKRSINTKAGQDRARIGKIADRTGSTVRYEDVYVCETCKEARKASKPVIEGGYDAIKNHSEPILNILDITLK